MVQITSDIIYSCVKKLCLDANIKLPKSDYEALYNLYLNEKNENAKNVLAQILQNAKIGFEQKRPLCQDTGLVTVFLSIGQNVQIIGENINNTINNAIADAYNEYFLRKSILNNPIERINTNNNTPALIHTNIVDGDEITITLIPKGGGCENVSAFKMLTPSAGLDGIKEFVIETIKNVQAKSCPPMKIGIGIGSNFEGSAILSKKALFLEQNQKYENYLNEIKNEINSLEIGAMGLGGNSTCFGINMLEEACHIASLPVSISISCHSSRHASATIKNNEIIYENNDYDFEEITASNDNSPEIKTFETETIRNLKVGSNILLTGKIYTARDAAHKKLIELIKNKQDLPFKLQNAIVFYAGPCPNMPNEIIGPIGPTTSARMDKFTTVLYEQGLLATIGKGERTQEIKSIIENSKGKYFTVTGGVASLLKSCIKSAKIIAYPELGAEAIYELEVEKLPVMVNI